MFPFLITVSVLYTLYYITIIGFDLTKNKDKASSHPICPVHVDFTVKQQPKNIVAGIQETMGAAGGEGKKNQQDEQTEKKGHQVQDIQEGLMDAEELQNFLNDLNIEFIKPDFSLAKPVNYKNIYEDAQSIA